MCSFPTLWHQDEQFRESYLNECPGYYKTADAGFKDEDGYIHVVSRTDDIINVAGHRLSTGGIEEVLSAHKDVAECAVIGIADTLKGEVSCGFVVLKTGVQRPVSEIGGNALLSSATRSARLPPSSLRLRLLGCRRRGSGKILRGTMKKIADGEPWSMPATIADPAILDEIGGALRFAHLVLSFVGQRSNRYKRYQLDDGRHHGDTETNVTDKATVTHSLTP